jgi:hypothetical protein
MPQLFRRIFLGGFAGFMVFNGVVGEARSPEQAIYQHAIRASAWIVTRTAQGTGFLVDRSDRFLITNYHVVRNHDAANVFFPLFSGDNPIGDRKHYIRYDRPIRGYVIARDPERDLALLRLEVVPHSAVPLPISTAGAHAGQSVYLMGNPGAERRLWTSNRGTVRRVGPETKRADGQREVHALFVEIGVDAPVLPGYSGGPVLNEAGALVGVTTLSNGVLPRTAQANRGIFAGFASLACGPFHQLACLTVFFKDSQRLAWCIDAREIHDVFQMVRSNPERASRLLDPHSAADYRDRGNYFLKKSRPDLAGRAFREAIRLDSRTHSAPPQS